MKRLIVVSDVTVEGYMAGGRGLRKTVVAE